MLTVNRMLLEVEELEIEMRISKKLGKKVIIKKTLAAFLECEVFDSTSLMRTSQTNTRKPNP